MGTAGAGLLKHVGMQGRKPRMSALPLLPRVPLGWCRGWQGPPAMAGHWLTAWAGVGAGAKALGHFPRLFLEEGEDAQ